MDGRAAGEAEALRAADNLDHVPGLTGPWPAYEFPEQGVEKVRDTNQAQEDGLQTMALGPECTESQREGDPSEAPHTHPEYPSSQEAGRAQIETLEPEGGLHVPLEAVYGDREVGRDQHRHQG